MSPSVSPPPSPCIAVCRLDDREVCLGCHRTLDEIRRWRSMSDSERGLVLEALSGRGSAEQ